MSVSTLTLGIETRAQAVLGAGWSKLAFVEDTSKNTFKGDYKGFGVLAGNIDQTNSTLGALTVTQNFQVKLIERWVPSQAGDSNKRSVIYDLQEKCLTIYKDLINTKAGSPLEVMNILEGMSTTTNFLDDGVVEIIMNIDILYRRTL